MRDGHVALRNAVATRTGRLDVLARQTVLPAARPNFSATAMHDEPSLAFALGSRARRRGSIGVGMVCF
jgi:hypothetical protein